MYLSDRDLEFAITTGQLIVNPPPAEFDTTSIDLHLDSIDSAKVWNAKAFAKKQSPYGNFPVLGVGRFDHEAFGEEFHMPVPDEDAQDPEQLAPNGFSGCKA